MAKCIGIWWNEQWYDETLEGLSKSVKHTKWPSALAYDEMNNEMIKWTMKRWNEQWNNEIRVWNTPNDQVKRLQGCNDFFTLKSRGAGEGISCEVSGAYP